MLESVTRDQLNSLLSGNPFQMHRGYRRDDLAPQAVSVILILCIEAPVNPAQIIPMFDTFLAERDLRFEAIAAGGAALALLGIVQRETRDFDVIEPDLPEAVQKAAQAFAALVRDQGITLRDDWLNNGPASLAPLLPEGWRSRLQPLFVGKALNLWSLGRPEFLRVKLWALCDRALDLQDCIALAPTPEELREAATWISTQDLHPDWPAHVQSTLEDLARRLGHGL